MEWLAADVIAWVNRIGPPFLAVMAFLETAFLTGFFVPAGVALLFASFLASEGAVALPAVVLWAVGGAVTGDATGFWIGRRLRAGAGLESRGWLQRVVATIDPRRLQVLRRTPIYSVSLARVIPFVRTLMPLSAGRSSLTFPRFLVYEAIGVFFWALSYVGGGYLAGESWRMVSGWIGGFWAAVFVVLLVLGSLGGRRARRRPQVESSSMIQVALTGNVASGKSTVAQAWAEAGVPVLSADVLAREVVEPGTPGLEAVVARFGEDVLRSDGTLDRALLRERVFGDDVERGALEAILHPRIEARRREWTATQRALGTPVVVYEIPLLFETGQEDRFDAVVLVDAPAETRAHRLVERRGLSREEALRIIEAQMPSAKKREGSDIVIDNTGGVEDLEREAAAVLDRIRRDVATGSDR